MNEMQESTQTAPPGGMVSRAMSWVSGWLERESWLTLLPGILVVALIFSEIQWSTPNVIGLDGYYHIKIAEVMRLAGLPAPIPFPWLQLTILAPDRFTDHHLLFHILLEPFTLFDLRVGAKLAAASFGSLAVLAVYGLLVWQRVRWSFLWLLLLFGISGAFLFRLSMTRRQSLVLLALLALIAVAFARRDRLALVVGFVFSWIYDGFLLFMLVAAMLTVGRWVDDGLPQRTWRRLRGGESDPAVPSSANGSVARDWLRWSVWSLLGWATLGALLGLLINPYSPRSFTFALEHALPKLVPAGDFVVGVGNEWYPYAPAALMRAAGAALVTVAVGFVQLAVAVATRRPLDGRVVALALLAVFFSILLVRSRRFVEYQPAFALLFCAFAWAVQMPQTVWERLRGRLPRGAMALAWCGLLVGAVLLMRPAIESAQNSARASRAVELYRGAAAWLQHSTPAGSRVFTTDWDDFPLIFFHNVHNTYLVGLDPTYMYQYDPALYREWRAITRGQVQLPSRAILERFGSQYVLTDLVHWAFLETAAADPGMRMAYRDEHAIVYVIEVP